MRKSVYIGIIVIILLLLIISLVIFTSKNKEENNTIVNAKVSNEQTNNIQKEDTNTQANETAENEIKNTMENEIIQNVIENTISSETLEESPQTLEEKAIAIVKKDWGKENNIEFSIDGMDQSGNYIVTVRDSQTTKALAFYTVNVASQTFTKREMN